MRAFGKLHLAAFGLFLIFSCKGPEGEIGPQGPSGATGLTGQTGSQGPQGSQGPAGATGNTGAQGEKGDKGDPGTANVIYSTWFGPSNNAGTPKNGSAWTSGNPSNDLTGRTIYSFTYTDATLASSTINYDQAAVLVYFDPSPYNSSFFGDIVALPWSIIFFNGHENWWFEMDALNDQLIIRLQSESVWGLTVNNILTNFTFRFRYIIIPGGTAGGRVKTPDLDFSDYQAVATYYGIPD